MKGMLPSGDGSYFAPGRGVQVYWDLNLESARLTVLQSVPVCGVEAGVQFADKGLSLPISLHPYPHLWSQAVIIDQKNKVMSPGSGNAAPPLGEDLYSTKPRSSAADPQK